MFLVAEMTLGLLGVITLLFNSTSYLTMLMVAPESAQALSSLSLLKQANWFAVATGMDGVVNVAILLVGGGQLISPNLIQDVVGFKMLVCEKEGV